MMKGKLVSFEGIDNCGKTTQIRLLKDYLNKHDIRAEAVRDPGGTSLGESLRRLLKNPDEFYDIMNREYTGRYDFKKVEPGQGRSRQAETFLFMASRAELVDKVIRPRIENGISVLCDRLGDSTAAYQGGGQYDNDIVARYAIGIMNEFAMGNYKPEKTFFLDIDYETMLARANSEADYFEKLGKEFYGRVINSYREIADRDKGRVVRIDGNGKSIDEIFHYSILPEARKIWGNI